jgi:hypothetical protein
MRGRLVLSVLLGAALALGLLAASASARKQALPGRTLTVHVKAGVVVPQEGPIEGIALDGTQAAFVKGVPYTKACGLGRRLYRWNLATGKTSLASGARTCAQPDTSTGRGIFEIALTRSGSAWLLNSGGNTESGEVLFSSTAKPHHDKVLATSDRYWDGQDPNTFSGTWIGGLASDGSRVWYATWTTEAQHGVTESALWQLSGSTAKQVASNSGAVVAASADRGRVALLHADGLVAVYGSDGTLLETFAPDHSAAGNVALTNKLVAVLTEDRHGRGDSIEVYDRTKGTLLHTWPAGGASALHFDAYEGIAVYVEGTRVHALDLKTGKDVVVAKRRRTIEAAALDKAGLLYYFNGPWSKTKGQNGTVVLVPFKTVAAKLGR